MPAIQITPAWDESVQVTIEVPQKGKKKPLKFVAPRYEFVSQEQVDKFEGWFREFDKEPDPKPEDWVKPVISDMLIFDQWVRILDMPDGDAIMGLSFGEKMQIWQAWQKESEAPLGKSEPSENG